ncbi:hypothetical protein [Microbacterium sp. NPDC096154]|uniref:hypothetical protein n=1 Tax=Microbacterium sp. NPDC096154 TaxID=3155549 RepID=UPI0033349E50
MRALSRIPSTAPVRRAARRAGRIALTLAASVALVAGALPAQAMTPEAAAAAVAPTPTPTPTSAESTPEPAPVQDAAAQQEPSPDTEYATPPVATIEREDLSVVVDSTPVQEEDAAGDVTPDVADPGNVPYPASGASSGTGDGVAGSPFELVRPRESIVSAAAVAGFAPGNIISNAVFSNRSTMTQAQIASFIDGKVAKCQSGYTCLENYVETTPTRAGDAYCATYTGGTRESAARIIYKVAQACGVNPQVLLVMLQKEQGLVTHTWPSEWRFTIAMGMGCPDTADCDKTYYGFFNQVFGAARQMNIYAKSGYFTRYAPGGTRSILYNPKSSCGSSGVYVQNQATANLYTYTPYQPNAAALAAGFGTGDSCSAYGNRNFFLYFQTWFGSTGGGTAAVTQPLVKLGSEVWIVTGSRRYHLTPEAYPEYKRVFGAPTVVTSAQLGTYTASGRADRYVRNTSTGVVAFLDGGQTHRFPSCGLVGQWGGSCGAGLVQLEPREFTRFAAGAEMSAFARVAGSTRVHRIEGSTLVPMFDDAAIRAYNAGKTAYAATMPDAAAATYQRSTRNRFAPGEFLLVEGQPEVWLATPSGVLFHLPSWQVAADLGMPRTVTSRTRSADLSGYVKQGTLSPMVTCAGRSYVGAGGTLHASAVGTGGLPATGLDGATCGTLDLSGASMTKGIFLKAAGASAVYRAESGALRHVRSPAQLVQFGGGAKPLILTVQPQTLAQFRMGQPYHPVVPGQFLTAGGPEVYLPLQESRGLLHLPHWSMAAEYGLPGSVGVRAAASEVGSWARVGSLGWVASCGGRNYFAGGGRLHELTGGVPSGFRSVALGAANCAALRLDGAKIQKDVFVQVNGRPEVYHLTGGVLRHVANPTQLAQLGGGRTPTIVKITPAGLGQLRMGAPYRA